MSVSKVFLDSSSQLQKISAIVLFSRPLCLDADWPVGPRTTHTTGRPPLSSESTNADRQIVETNIAVQVLFGR